ncbi:MAG: RloB family protein [Marinicella sp.]
MPRESHDYRRISGIRKPDLIVIAFEGKNTEPQYFESYKEQILDQLNSQLKLKILNGRKSHQSSPTDVINELDEFKKEFSLNAGDELCAVIDRDKQSWSEKQLSDVAKKCDQKKYLLALSNPCFELWLILHHIDVSNLSDEKKEQILENKNEHMKKLIRSHVGSYNPSKLNFDDFKEGISLAVERAEKLDLGNKGRWPNKIGTRVYLIVKKIQNIIDNM